MASPRKTSIGAATKMYRIVYSRQSQKDAKKLAAQPALRNRARELVEIIKNNPFQNPPPYEKLVGDMASFYSRRINIQHRLVYQVLEEERIIHILRMWTHYE